MGTLFGTLYSTVPPGRRTVHTKHHKSLFNMWFYLNSVDYFLS